MTLMQVLADPAKKSAVVADVAQLIDDEVQARGGLSGIGLKAGYRAIKAIKPGIIRVVLDMMLPEFAPILDPFYNAGVAEGNVEAHFRKRADPIANALLAVTDGRAQRTTNAAIKRAYLALRSTAQREVAASVPKLAPLIARHVK